MSFNSQVDFPMGICDFPYPDSSDPEFGQYVRGRVSEANAPAVFRLWFQSLVNTPILPCVFFNFLPRVKTISALIICRVGRP